MIRTRGRLKLSSHGKIAVETLAHDSFTFYLPCKPNEEPHEKTIGRSLIKIVPTDQIPSQADLPDNAIAPQPKQSRFCAANADIVIYGGSAGSGKSLASLIDPIRYFDNPKFRAIIIRKSGADLRNPGGLIDASMEVYPQLGGTYSMQSMDWRFPSGARLSFRHCEHENDIYNFLGSEFAYISFDELALLKERVFWFLLSRNRSTSGVRPQIRATCNPDAESFLANLLDWWIAEDGYADLSRSGIVRHLIRVNGEVQFGDNLSELIDRFGEDISPKSFTFIPATIYDNQKLLDVNPEYLANLKAQHPVDQERFLGDRERGGNWKIRLEAGTIFSRAWFEIVDEAPDGGTAYRFWDLAATAKAIAKQTSFYTCGVKVKKVGDTYYVLDVVYDQISPAGVADFMFAIANQDSIHVPIRWELEGGSAGLIVEQVIKQRLHHWDAQAIKPKGDKVTRAIPSATAASVGKVKLLRAAWNDAFLSAVQNFDGTPKPLTNDIVDSFDGAFDCAEQGTEWLAGNSFYTEEDYSNAIS